MRLKLLPAFLFGCMVGCITTTMLYVSTSGMFSSEQYRVPNALFAEDFRNAPKKLKVENLHLYLSAIGSHVSPINKQLGKPSTLSAEYDMRKMLLGAVLTSASQLNATASIVNETWGSAITDYRIIVTEDAEIPAELQRFPIMQLKVSSLLSQTFSLLKLLHERFSESYKWFLIVTDQTYVAARELEGVLSHLDPYQIIYMGNPGSVHPMEMIKLRLITNEFYCERGPGFVLSSTALSAIVPYLDECLDKVSTFARDNGLLMDQPDVELGRCFSRNLDVRCSTSQEALNYFVYDEKGESVRPDRLWYNPDFQNLLTLYPIQSATHMRSVHNFCKMREFERLKQKLLIVEKSANQICQSVEEGFRAPSSEIGARECQLQAFNECHTHHPIDTKSLPKPFYPTNKFELNSWEYVDSTSVHTSLTTIPIQDIFGENEEELQFIIKKAVQLINKQEATAMKFQAIENGYLRYSATRGREYILDLMLLSKQGKVPRRVNILRAHQPELIVLPDSDDSSRSERINFIVPLSRVVNERFMEFLEMYEELCLKRGENSRLILSIFGDGKDLQFIRNAVKKYTIKYPTSEFEIVSSQDEFTRGRALDFGMLLLEDNDLAFLCDVDMSLDASFLNRCRMNAVRGQRVYYPEFFKYYNMDYVYRFKRRPHTFKIKREHGHWAAYSYGMLCIYKSDYTTIGGFDKSIVGWGGEDVNLFMRILKHKLDVLKAPDPALTHRYHDKQCGTSLQPMQFSMCISSRNEGLADRMQLAEYVLYLEDMCGVTERRLWHN